MTFLEPTFLWLIIPSLLLFSKKKGNLLLIGHIVVLVLITIALSRPALKDSLSQQKIETKDIIIALDLSYSMRAKDSMPNRYDFAKATIEAFLKNNPKTTITLLAFTQNPLLLSPPTTDHELILVALKTLNPDYILTKGTSLHNLLNKVGSLKNEDKNLLLITDGGEEQTVEKFQEIIVKNQIKLSILAVGTERGATIPTPNGLLKDKKGHLVISAINPMLKRLTSHYIQASSSVESTAKSLEKILDIEKTKEITKPQQNYQELYQFPLIFAILLFLMLHTRAIKYIITFLLLFGISAEASLLESYHIHQAINSCQNKEYKLCQYHLKKVTTPSLERQYALANVSYRLKEYKKAIALYQTIHSTSPIVKQKIYHNIANSYAQLKNYKKAKENYTKALQLGYDEDSYHNLGIVIFKENKEKSSLGIANPKSQSSDSSKSENQEDLEESKENQPSSASGSSNSGSQGNEQKDKKEESRQLRLDPNQEQEKEQQQPLSSKLYELINKGYIYETKPW